ncbi:MAG: RNA-binding domain-containing protein, partial [Candidatus Sericytochromatia bacterium]
MTKERVIQLLQKKENIQLEFKEAHNKLPSNLFETICAMLNRSGGDIILGADNNGSITGIEKDKINSLKTELVTLSNNPEQLKPPFILFPQSYEINDKCIIHIQVPSSSQVHKKSNTVYDRSDDGDFKINEPHRIAELYNQKRIYYTETKIYKYLKFEDFNQKLFPKIRNLIKGNNPNHPWLKLNYQQMLKTAGLWRIDSQTGEEGYTLASALLFGKPEVILSIAPYYKIDALVRKIDKDRYDDREYIQVNLIEAYDKLMDFISKHLPDKFHLIRDQRVSLRNKIFREVIANLLIHREYMNAEPARLIIYSDRVETLNPNNPKTKGQISPDNFTPFSKNPLIAKFFTQLGWVDELGSGVLNVTNYLKAYSGKEPQFIEDNTFKTIIPLDEIVNYKDVGTNEIIVGEKL